MYKNVYEVYIMLSTNENNIYPENLYNELETTRDVLYDLISDKDEFCEDEILAVSRKLDELLVKDMHFRKNMKS